MVGAAEVFEEVMVEVLLAFVDPKGVHCFGFGEQIDPGVGK